MKLRLIVPFLLLLFVVPTLRAQNVTVRAEVDSTGYLIGQWIVTHLDVKAPKDVKLTFPAGDDDIEGGEFVSLGTESIDAGEVSKRIRRDLTVTVFDTGRIALTVLLRYRLPGDTTTYIARSNTLTLTLGAIALDTSITFKDIKDVLHVPLTIWDYLLIIGIIAAVVLLAWYAYKRWKNRPQVEVVLEAPPVPEIPAHVEALEGLDRLSRDAPWLAGDHKGAQSRLSEILRLYIERRYRFPALEQTTGEIMRNLAPYGIDRPLLIQLEQTLRVADLAKFARFEPSYPQHEEGVRFGRNFVERTAETLQHAGAAAEGGQT